MCSCFKFLEAQPSSHASLSVDFPTKVSIIFKEIRNLQTLLLLRLKIKKSNLIYIELNHNQKITKKILLIILKDSILSNKEYKRNLLINNCSKKWKNRLIKKFKQKNKNKYIFQNNKSNKANNRVLILMYLILNRNKFKKHNEYLNINYIFY